MKKFNWSTKHPCWRSHCINKTDLNPKSKRHPLSSHTSQPETTSKHHRVHLLFHRCQRRHFNHQLNIAQTIWIRIVEPLCPSLSPKTCITPILRTRTIPSRQWLLLNHQSTNCNKIRSTIMLADDLQANRSSSNQVSSPSKILMNKRRLLSRKRRLTKRELWREKMLIIMAKRERINQ